ncbi:MAG: hypothetical protein M3173_06465, partial [Chloroflexota bacterium]|nr:hypothetical protein [Chloroflexota bacterium]
MPRIPDDLTRSHPSRPVPWLPWAASILFLIGIIALVGTLIAAIGRNEDAAARLQVLDAQTNGPISNAAVLIDGETYSTDEHGWVNLPTGSGDVAIAVAHDGYVGREGTVPITSDQRWSVTLRPDLEAQVVLEPTAEAAAEQEQLPVTGDASTPEIAVQTSTTNTGEQTQASATPSAPTAPASELAGRITNADGEPVQGAMLTDGQNVEITGQDGLFAVKAQDFTADTLRVSAPGYADTALSFAQAGQPIELQLDLQPIKAIYYNPNISSTPEDLDRLIEIINTTEVNAIVVDVKEEIIFYDTQVEFFRDVDVVTPVIDVPALLARFDEHNIYTIARHVVFKDSLVAERRPDLAVKNVATGEVWRDMNGVAWVNPMLHDLWDANIALAVELAELGFDEIQYDYVRFPTDGDLASMDFGLEYNEENRVAAITKLLDRTSNALLPTGAKLSADVFGFTVLVPDDLGIGQDLTELAPHLDYL